MKLSNVNTVLVICILLVNGYILITPLLPNVTYIAGTHSGKQQQLSRQLHTKTLPDALQLNQLIIPKMLLTKPIYDGSNAYAELDKGVWRWPASSTPDKGGNTVLLAHRFTYTQPEGVFYHLDTVTVGDEIGLIWNTKRYLYKVDSISVVPPTEVSILQATAASRLTLYTCTPLWWPKNRLVVVATLVRNDYE